MLDAFEDICLKSSDGWIWQVNDDGTLCPNPVKRQGNAGAHANEHYICGESANALKRPCSGHTGGSVLKSFL